MLKFVVVGYRRSELTREQFRRYFREIHGPLATRSQGCGVIFRTSYNQTSGGSRPGTSWWNSGSMIEKRWSRPGSRKKDAGRLTTTRTVWTSSGRDGQSWTKSSSWLTEHRPPKLSYDGAWRVFLDTFDEGHFSVFLGLGRMRSAPSTSDIP